MTDASSQSPDRTDETTNSSQTAPNPNNCRLLTDGGQAQTEAPEDESESEGDESDAASNGQSESSEESSEESTDEAESESTDETAEADGADQTEDDAEAESAEDGEGDDEGTTVLFLDLEGLFLDVLGLEVDLNEVKLDVSAVSGPGNLLGNLLDAVSGLLGSGDSGLLMDIIGGSLFEGIVPDEEGEGGLLGGDEDGDEEGEDGEGRLTEAAGSAKESLSEAFEGVPFDEILTSVLKELVEQMFDSSDGSDESGSGSDA